MKNNLGLESIFYAGRAMQNIGLEDLVVLKAKNRKERLNVYLPGSYKPFAFTNSTTAGIIKNDIMTVKSKSKRYFNPVFFLFEEKKLNINSIVMRDFKNIKFKI